MALYPSLEDMQIDKIIQAQRNAVASDMQQQARIPNAPPLSGQAPPNNAILYPTLSNFLGLELSPETIRENMPEYLQERQVTDYNPMSGTIAPLTGMAPGPASAQVTNHIRELILCKDACGKVGLRVQEVNNGIFVCIVVKDSPAALGGLRFGDQILQINGTNVAGYSGQKIHKMLKASNANNISIVVRDRPFERTVTLVKNSAGNLGFQFKNGKITAIVPDSSAGRNGVLTDHNLLEVNGQTVVALKDKEITQIIEDSGKIVKVTIIPSFIYDHMVKRLSTSFLRGIMDHSIPEF